jgi:hypothetical protein
LLALLVGIGVWRAADGPPEPLPEQEPASERGTVAAANPAPAPPAAVSSPPAATPDPPAPVPEVEPSSARAEPARSRVPPRARTGARRQPAPAEENQKRAEPTSKAPTKLARDPYSDEQ